MKHFLKINNKDLKLFMKKFLKLKNGGISIFLLLIFNQFLFSSYALNSKKNYKHYEQGDIVDKKNFC